jgi:hypothetical protein
VSRTALFDAARLAAKAASELAMLDLGLDEEDALHVLRGLSLVDDREDGVRGHLVPRR